MKILITGARGMLGRALCCYLTNHELIATNKETMDITDSTLVSKIIHQTQPDVVIHCAAMTAVDLCEFEKEKAYLLNAVGTANIASACNLNRVRLISISTDYVFNGDAKLPYTEYDIPTGGHTVYGQSKFAGERAVQTHCPNHVLVRLGWLYGPGGPSFVHSILKQSRKGIPVLKVVDDQFGNPTSTTEVARALSEIIDHPEICGTFHLTCEGNVSWYEFAKKIFELQGIKQEVLPCTSQEYPRPASRPHNSCLQKLNLKLFGLSSMKRWDAALKEALSDSSFFKNP